MRCRFHILQTLSQALIFRQSPPKSLLEQPLTRAPKQSRGSSWSRSTRLSEGTGEARTELKAPSASRVTRNWVEKYIFKLVFVQGLEYDLVGDGGVLETTQLRNRTRLGK